MKRASKMLVLLLAIAMLISVMPAAVLADTVGDSVTPFDGKFLDQDEDGYADSWGELECESAEDNKPYEAYDGNVAVVYETTAYAHQDVTYPMPEEGEYYYVSGWIRGKTPRTIISFQNADGEYAGQFVTIHYPPSDLVTWQWFKIIVDTSSAQDGAVKFAISVANNRGDDGRTGYFADLKVTKSSNSALPVSTAWGSPGSEVASAITGGVAGFEGADALQIDLDKVTATYKIAARIKPSSYLKAKTLYKVTTAYKTDDPSKYAPSLRFVDFHISGNYDKGFTQATTADTWTPTEFYFVTPDEISSASTIQLLLGNGKSSDYNIPTYVTISDIVVEEVPAVAFPTEAELSAPGTVNVNYLFVNAIAGSDTAPKRNIIAALTKVDGDMKTLCAVNVVTSNAWNGTYKLPAPTDLEIPLTISDLEAGTYEMSVMAVGQTDLAPISLYTQSYTID